MPVMTHLGNSEKIYERERKIKDEKESPLGYENCEEENPCNRLR